MFQSFQLRQIVVLVDRRGGEAESLVQNLNQNQQMISKLKTYKLNRLSITSQRKRNNQRQQNQKLDGKSEV